MHVLKISATQQNPFAHYAHLAQRSLHTSFVILDFDFLHLEFDLTLKYF